MKTAEKITHPKRATQRIVATACALFLTASLCGCQSSNTAAKTSQPSSSDSFETAEVVTPSFNGEKSETGHGCSIDTTHVSNGYVTVKATSKSKLKFQVVNGSTSYNYDLSNDGTVECYTLNMGDGAYTFSVMQNVEKSNYIELFSATANVTLSSEFAPFLCPGPYCDFDETSACVEKARKLVDGAKSESDAVNAVYEWVISNISYDKKKASQLTNVTGYKPDPDTTLSSKKGICLDYACLLASMLRSVGVPTKVVTGYVSDDSIYHAWNLVYVDGKWTTVSFAAKANSWSRVDSTFAAGGNSDSADGKMSYEDHYIY